MQNSIEDSVHSLLKDEITRIEFEGFEIEKATIYHQNGGEFKFKGLARNPSAVKSMHGFKYFWVEEAQSISQDSLDMLTPTVRTEDSEIWFSMNPMSSEDPVAKRFLKPFESQLLRDGYYEDDMHMIVLINYYDNPWFPDVLEQERAWDYKHKPRAEYDHIWLGKFNDSVPNSIIPIEWFDAAIDAHIKLGFKPKGVKVASFDPSDTGDAKGYALRHGSVFLDVDELTTGDGNEGCDWATDKAIGAQADLFTWDADGLGVTLKRQIEQSLAGKKMGRLMFKGSQEPDRPDDRYLPADERESEANSKTNKETFVNKRAQYYWMLRDKFYNTYRASNGEYVDPDTMISLSSEIKSLDKIRAEICRIPRKYNGNGRIQIMGKPEMKTSLKIASPNMADAIMMSQVIPEQKAKWKTLTYPKVATA